MICSGSKAFVWGFDYFCGMKSLRHIVWCFALPILFACAKRPLPISEEVMQYDSGIASLQRDSLIQELPYFFQVAQRLEALPDDMDSAAIQLTAQAYSQMAFAVRMKMENNAEIDALQRVASYQERLADTLGLMRSWLGLAGGIRGVERTRLRTGLSQSGLALHRHPDRCRNLSAIP